jgi:uncharacterized protein (DUF2147 family)
MLKLRPQLLVMARKKVSTVSLITTTTFAVVHLFSFSQMADQSASASHLPSKPGSTRHTNDSNNHKNWND